MNEQAHWVVLGYLAAHGATDVAQPTHEDLDLDGVLDAAKRCADFRSNGRFIALPVPSAMALRDDPWREVFGLAGSIGESLMLAAGCEIEVEWHRRARGVEALPPQFVVGQRFFSTAELQEVLGVGHRLLNLVLRAVAIEPDLRDCIAAEKALKRWAAVHRPFLDDRRAWESLNATTVGALRQATAHSPHPAIRSLVDALLDLVTSKAWEDLAQSRGRDFHRWRAESSVLAGLDDRSGHIRAVLGPDGTVHGHAFTDLPARYEMADGLEEETAGLARAALIVVAAASDRVLAAMVSAVEPLSRGRLMPESGNLLSVRIGGLWDETRCGCCSS